MYIVHVHVHNISVCVLYTCTSTCYIPTTCINMYIHVHVLTNLCVCVCCRFPEGSLYHTEGSWKLLRIGEGPLGFGGFSYSHGVKASCTFPNVDLQVMCHVL